MDSRDYNEIELVLPYLQQAAKDWCGKDRMVRLIDAVAYYDLLHQTGTPPMVRREISADYSQSQAAAPMKRRRGRPRKNPIPDQQPAPEISDAPAVEEE